MSSRPNWDGFLRFNLIAVPVRAYSAAAPARGKIGFHLLHKGCNQRIRYQKVCPIHGEVEKGQIVSGYEFAKDEYVVVDLKELESMRTASDKTINVAAFIRPKALDPVYYTERSYYLVPSGKAGQVPFAVLREVMADEERYAVAQVIFSGREQLALVRPLDRLLLMTMLSFAAQVKEPAPFEDEVADVKLPAKERELAKSLIDTATVEDFDFGQYVDTYTSKLRELIEAKAEGKRIVVSPPEEEPHVINLMDALKRSLNATKKQRSRAKSKTATGRTRVHRARSRSNKRKTG
jgi:DNA end-binding protein Ku